MNRNNNSREEKLAEKLVNHSIEIDTNNLWQSIRTDLPIVKKRRPILPLLFMAVFGMLTGALATYIIIKEKDTPSIHIEKYNKLSQKIDSLYIALNSCQSNQIKVTHSNIEKIQDNTPNAFSSDGYQTHLVKVNKIIQATNDNMSTVNDQYQKNDLKDIFNVVPKDNAWLNHKNKINQSEITPFFVSSLPLINNNIQSQTPMLKFIDNRLKVIVHEDRNIVRHQWYSKLGFGFPIINDQINSSEAYFNYYHLPVYNVSSEIGFQYALHNKINICFGFNSMFSASKIDYNFTKEDQIKVNDTISQNISINGILSYPTGDVYATKIVNKKGSAYNYHTVFGLNPNITYTILRTKKSSFDLNIGTIIPIVQMSKGAVLTNVNELEKYSISLPFKLNQPIYNGTINYSTSISNKELGFYLSAIIGKHSIIINDNLYMRNYIIPQAGMRLDF